MSATNHKLLADRVWEEVWHEGVLERIDELFAPYFVRHDPGREIHGPEENRRFVKGFRAAFPDLHFTVLDQISEGDKVAVRYRFQGTHLGGISGSAKRVVFYPSCGGFIWDRW